MLVEGGAWLARRKGCDVAPGRFTLHAAQQDTGVYCQSLPHGQTACGCGVSAQQKAAALAGRSQSNSPLLPAEVYRLRPGLLCCGQRQGVSCRPPLLSPPAAWSAVALSSCPPSEDLSAEPVIFPAPQPAGHQWRPCLREAVTVKKMGSHAGMPGSRRGRRSIQPALDLRLRRHSNRVQPSCERHEQAEPPASCCEHVIDAM